MNKRALLIAFHFPPQAGSSGIQRTLSFSKHLGKYGWEPMVVSAHPRAYTAKNQSQLSSVPAGLVVERAFALDAKLHLGFKNRYPQLAALPDRWISWWFGAIPRSLALIRQYKPQVIWSTFPIATAHLIGLTLHRLTGLPWVADFRDPMVQPSHPSSKLQRKMYAWIEKQALLRCQTAVFTTRSAMDSCLSRYPQLPPSKCVVIENGYEEDGFRTTTPAPAGTLDPARRITLVHSGVLYQTGRDPSAFLRAISELKRQGFTDGNSLHVILRAPGKIAAITELVAEHGLADIVQVLPAIPYHDALQEMLAADGLVVFQGTPFNTQIPAKVYEYFRAGKPILGLVDPKGETARVLGDAGFECLCPPDDAGVILPVLKTLMHQIRTGTAHVASSELVAQSSRAGRTRELATVFDRAIAFQERSQR